MAKQITDYANEVLNEKRLKDMRDSIAGGLLTSASLATDSKQSSEQVLAKQKALEQRFINLQQATTDGDFNSAPEIIDARGGKPTLGARLDETTAQLAQTETDMFYSKSVDHNTRKAIMSFVDDDGRSEFYTKWKPIIENKNIPVTSALVTSRIGVDERYLTMNQVLELKNLGVEFVSHSHNHEYLGELTESELRANFELSQAFLKQHNLTHDVLVYPYGSQSDLLRRVAREYFACGVDIINGYNTPPLSTYRIQRMSLKDSPLSEYKAKIDEVVLNGGWLVWISHAQYPEFTPEQAGFIEEIVDYARSLGIDIVNVKEGLKRKGNLVDVGDIEAASWSEVAVIDSNGDAYGQGIGSHKFISYDESGIDINGNLSQFAKNCNTVMQINAGSASGLGLPGDRPGLLETYRGLSAAFGEQVFHRYRTSLKYTRYWNSTTSEWSSWSIINAYDYLGLNGVENSTPVTDERLVNKFTSTFINSSGSSGFPENKAGLLLTYANFTGSQFPRQEYTVYATNKKYTRYWSGSAWTDWVQLGGGSGSTLLRPTSVHIGYMYFDTTLKKPIWWDGTNWRDATGTTV